MFNRVGAGWGHAACGLTRRRPGVHADTEGGQLGGCLGGPNPRAAEPRRRTHLQLCPVGLHQTTALRNAA